MSTLRKKTNKKTILVAENDEAISKAISQLLENARYVADPIIDGLKIISRVKKTLPALLLLDVSMPGVDGYDICKQLKENERVRHIPIIMMSANKDIKKMAKEAGANDFVAKPFDIFDLLHKIKKHVVYT